MLATPARRLDHGTQGDDTVDDVRDLQDLVTDALRALGTKGKPMTPRAASERVHGAVSAETIRLLANGTHSGDLKDDTIGHLVNALNIKRSDLLAALNRTHVSELGPWKPPAVADRMTRRQRKAVDSIIAAMVDPGEQEGKLLPLKRSFAAEKREGERMAARKRSPNSRPLDREDWPVDPD